MELFRLFFFFGNFLFENVRYFKKKTTDFYSLLKIKIMTKTDFIDFCDNYAGSLTISGNIAMDVNTGVFYELI